MIAHFFKYAPLILFAAAIDGLQMVLSWATFALGAALTAATPFGAGLAGCAAGWALSRDAASGAVNCIKGGAVMAVASPAGMPLGIALGGMVGVGISATLGLMLVLTLWYLGMFTFGRVGGGMLFELLPIFDSLPGWTVMTTAAVYKKWQTESKKAEEAAENDPAPYAYAT